MKVSNNCKIAGNKPGFWQTQKIFLNKAICVTRGAFGRHCEQQSDEKAAAFGDVNSIHFWHSGGCGA